MTSMTPFLMFQDGRAGDALAFYVATVPNSRIVSVEHFTADGPGPAGTVLRALVEIAGQRVMAHDSHVKHAFGFTPSSSFFVECAEDAEIERLFAALSEGGETLMPLDNYGFSRRFGWFNDRFGVSWQVNLA
jgi:predicted 3-demethylubiquinone-9 3-methyltransferase (glyoxalase superfamily)